MAIMTAMPPLATPVKRKVAIPPIVPTPAKRKVRLPSAQEIAAAAHRARWVPYAGLAIGIMGIGLSIWLARSPIEPAALLPWKTRLDAAVRKG